MLELVEDLGMKFPRETSKQKRRFGRFKCFCGNYFECEMQSVKYGYTKSCGCLNSKLSKERFTTHGLSNHRLSKIWFGMVRRCTIETSHKYESYGGRGITICERWMNIENFINDMYPSFEEGMSLDRIDNDGNYEPSNCRWASKSTQAQNIKKIRTNNASGYKGVFFNTQKQKYQAKIQFSNIQKHLGFFEDARRAALEYDHFIIEHKLMHTKNFS